MASEAENYANLVLKWISSQPGGRVHADLQAMRDPYGGIGLFMTAETQSVVQKGTELFSVPRSCMIEVPHGTPTRHRHAALALQLLHLRSSAQHEGGPKSKWEEFIKSLPSPESLSGMLLIRHMPTYGELDVDLKQPHASRLSDEPAMEHNADLSSELEWISCSPLLYQAFDLQRKSIMDEYRRISSGEISFQSQSSQITPPSLPEYVWARCIVASRAIQLWAGPTLVPLADFLNHKRPPNAVLRCSTPEVPQGDGDGGYHSSSRCNQGRSIYSPPPSSNEGDTDNDNSDEDGHDSSLDDGFLELDEAQRGGAGDPAAGGNQSSLDHQCFVCEAIRDLEAGEEVQWVYNSHTHDVGWLLGYGFVPRDRSSSPSCHADQLEDLGAAIERIQRALEQASAGDGCNVSAELTSLLTRERDFMIGLQSARSS